MTSIQGTIAQREPARFAASCSSGAHKGNRSLRRRLMMALRLAHRVLGPRRDRLGCGMLGIGGSLAGVASAAAMLVIATPAQAQYAAGGGTATASGSIAIGAPATASQLNAVAIGTRSVSSTQYGVAIGQDASATGTGGAVAVGGGAISNNINTVALGVNANAIAAGASALGTAALASGGNSTAVGVGSTASNSFAWAGGYGSEASGVRALALGFQATASGLDAVAQGNSASAGAQNAVAIGFQATATTINSVYLGSRTAAGTGALAQSAIAIGTDVTASQADTIAMGRASRATAVNATAIGLLSNASGLSSSAFGRSANASADFALALGNGSVSSGTASVAAGSGAQATNAAAIAVGNNANASALNAIAMGTSAVANSADAVAIGNGSTATGGKAVSIGSGNVANGNGAVAIGDPNTATGDGAVAQGMDNTATGNGSVAMGNTNMVGGGGQAVSTPGTAAQGAVGIGYQNTVTGQGAVAIGDRNIANGVSAIAMGSQANAAAANAMALGAGATATHAGSVALGSGSVTAVAVPTPNTIINGTTYNFAGAAPTSTVSVGAVGAERTITNVAAGRISSTSTDAINGSQLFATNQAITAVGTGLDTFGTSVSTALGGTSAYNPTTNQVTAGLAIGGTTYNNVQSALTAVNGTASAGWNLQANGGAATNVAPGGTVQLLNGQNISVTRSGTDITIATTPALTADSLTLSSGQVFNAAGLFMNGTGISGLLDGTVSATSTEAINGSQLYGTSLSIANILGGGAIVNPDGTVSSPTYTIAGSSYTTVGGAFTAIDDAISGGGGIKYFHANSTLADSSAAGTDSVAIGPQSVATGNNSLAAGLNAQASANTSLAIGQNTQSTVLGGVALGSGSVADRAIAPASGSILSGTQIIPYNTSDKILLGAVSVGNSTSFRQITNVADGTEDQDAVTIRQLKGALSSFAVSSTNYFHANSTASDSLAVGVDSVAIGPRTTVNGDNGIGMGNGAVVQMTAPGGISIGHNSTVNLADGIALGTNSTANGIQAMALGAGATANEPGSVALGAGSTTAAAVATTGATINGVAYTFAGTNPTSTVSVGGVGSERTITNVAAGRISATSTDAINGSQLHATNQAVESLQTGIGDLEEVAVKYDQNPDGTKANSITLVGGDPGAPVVIHNVGAGVADTDAANVGQVKAIAGTVAGSKKYTDDRATWAVGQAKTYTDEVAGTTLNSANAYTDSRLSQLNTDLGGIRSEARQAAAIGLAAASLRYDDRPGKLSVAAGGGYWRNEGAFAFGAGYTSEDGRVRANLSGTTAGGAWGVGAGLSVTLN
ncbi:YadA-like family protein [Sinorhizobium numidicum]|uniref:YadA-like family protein n=1 Tax=Sinorhizobium numidicum TaxID=680248 RepID=A0ABY8CRS0_9HYPH|nr:YadA-like family protein [Sinorhizobium numidicum]WEX75349.1 YadA-like family protein [Sinorhizobium numidicum]WEX81344.1 YadA-like family protein [Sinorhizobium numidicum]